jgi:rod shape-determining protein MreD
MAILTYSSRQEMVEHSFHPAVALLVPLAAIFIQVNVPRLIPAANLFDLPLIVVLFFAVGRRGPIAGTITGSLTGLAQDFFSGQYIGIFGISKSIIGYLASLLSGRIDVESLSTRLLLSFGFTLLHNWIVYVIRLSLLGQEMQWFMVHELLRAVLNMALAVPVLFLLDRTKRRDHR